MTELSQGQLTQCSERLGYQFVNDQYLREALVHRSWQAENNEPVSNERLEFLGDAVLGWVIADLAFHRLVDKPEGKLTDLRRSVVNMHALADVARGIGIGEFVLLGKGEEAAGGHDKSSILADALEALIGAVYLDGGPIPAFALVQRLMTQCIEEAIPHLATFDAKTRLQELCARLGLGVPSYETEGVGPDHERIFTATAIVGGHHYGSGDGRTKKAAEQVAALEACEAIEREFDA
jgi:ribonuclease-3